LGFLVVPFNWLESRRPIRDDSRLKILSLAVSVAAGVVVTVFVFRPGVMSPDSLYQYRQAATGAISSDTTPPIMSFVWSYLLRVVPGPFGMMLFHVLMFWTGLGLIAAAVVSRPLAAAWCVLAIGFCPPVFGLLGIVWKDIGLGSALILFSGLTLLATKLRSRWLFAVSIVPLFYGASVRFNAVPALFPLGWWLWGSIPLAARWPRSLARATIVGGLTLTLILVGLSRITNEAMVSTREATPDVALQGSMLFDLAGISVRTGELQLPDHLRRAEVSLAALRTWYDPGVGDNGILRAREFLLAQTPQQYEDLKRVWRQSVRAHPAAYLRHRARVFATVIQIRGIYDAFHRGIDPNDLGLTFPPRALYDTVLRLLDRATPFLFRGWFFLVAAIVVLWRGWVCKSRASIALAASALAYVAPYIVVSGGSDFRYVWWPVIATLIGLVVLTPPPAGAPAGSATS
jgi:hypothetical protein